MNEVLLSRPRSCLPQLITGPSSKLTSKHCKFGKYMKKHSSGQNWHKPLQRRSVCFYVSLQPHSLIIGHHVTETRTSRRLSTPCGSRWGHHLPRILQNHSQMSLLHWSLLGWVFLQYVVTDVFIDGMWHWQVGHRHQDWSCIHHCRLLFCLWCPP